MLRYLMRNQLLSIDAELEKDRFKGLEMRDFNDTKILLCRSFGGEKGCDILYHKLRAIFKQDYLLWRNMTRHHPEVLRESFVTPFLGYNCSEK